MVNGFPIHDAKRPQQNVDMQSEVGRLRKAAIRAAHGDDRVVESLRSVFDVLTEQPARTVTRAQID